MTTNLKTLIGKLNDTTRRAAERAASLTMARGHYEVDIEHVFLALLEDRRSDMAVLCRHFAIASASLQADLEREIGRFKTGNTRTPVFSTRLATLLENAWLIASLDAHDARIRGAHLLLALLTEPGLAQLAQRSSKQFAKVAVDELKHRLDETTAGSEESSHAGGGGSGAGTSEDAGAAGEPGKTPALDQFTTHLTARARAGKLDPVIGRETEIRQVIDILLRRRQNNPILTGEAGVGKTAVSRAWPCASLPGRCRRRCRAWRCTCSTWAFCRLARA